MVKLANNTYVQLGVFMSSAMVVQAIGWNQSTRAVEFNNPLLQQLQFSSAKKGVNLFQSGALQLDNSTPMSTSPLSQSEQTIPTSDRSQSYLANANSSAQTTPLTYQVKQGDTITKIASEYQVSRNELIKLNQIPNSNIIFVNQKLKIPPTAIQNNALNSASPAIANLTTITNSGNSGNSGNLSQPNIKKISVPTSVATSITPSVVPSADEDPYIANLRAEIDQLRAQYKQEQQAKVNNNANSARLVSVIDPQPEQRAKPRPSQISTTARLNSPAPERNLQSNLIKQDAIALKLPPLSNSEEYLPNTFDGYAWPAEGVITSGYGFRWGRMHEGIDIAAPIGTPVLAAASGEVVGAGWHSGYGNLIQIKHLDGSVTLYGHNNRILVTHGQQVKQGEQIAEMGSTGNSTGSHVHFEIHLRDEAVIDPLTLLSSQ
jgi:murein DD-endopeptidase MepM/ murein hydrolase activator NlpD